MSLSEQQQLEERYLMHTYGRLPVQFVRGTNSLLFDDAGAKYLDFFSGIGVISCGHANEQVNMAIKKQLDMLLHVGNYYYVQGRGELAEKLNMLLNKGLLLDDKQDHARSLLTGEQPESCATVWKTFFVNSGTEANEGAIKIARKHGVQNLDGAMTIISAKRSFHGRTLGALAATGQPVKQEAFGAMPAGFKHVELNDLDALINVLDDKNQPACAIILESIQGEGGIWPCDSTYLREVRELSASRNICLIIDEVQSGFYRSGGYPFAFQHYGIIPDVVSLAKGMGNGFPVGAFCAKDKFGELLQPGEHGSTFGGNPLAVCAANAVIDFLEKNEIAKNVRENGAVLLDMLKTLPHVVDVRGRGFMIGIQLDVKSAHDVVKMALAKHLVINATSANTLRLLPVLTCNREDVNIALEILSAVLNEL
ncbi:MAG: aminotransferase class III-fold pyridoxal phosphate-dependent enzyme [Coriobacteriales bacterium]|jgi:acetylornithine aminotransferase|nr:aminotransferase class III-fold pyridoxal phosphate-dependent enzyme [Coriobacteriales bacterium]